MNFLKRWLMWSIVVAIIFFVLGNVFFDLTWFHSRDEIPLASLCAGGFFGFFCALKSND